MPPGVAFLVFDDKTDRLCFEEFVLQKLPTLLDEYAQALSSKGYKDHCKQRISMFLVGQKVTKLRLGIYTNNIEELWAARF